MLEGVNMDLAITIDIEDKIMVAPERYNKNNLKELIINNLDNRIGEISNMSSCYHNKMKKTEKARKIHDDNISFLSIVNGKEIDSSKTGIHFSIPKYIQQYAKPLPYFLKYRSPYYARLADFNKFKSNMNSLCFMIEEWERNIKNNKIIGKDFDYTIMLDKEVVFNQKNYDKIKEIYLSFNKLKKELGFEKKMLNDYAKEKIKKREDFQTQEGYDDYIYMRKEKKDKLKEKFHNINKHIASIYDVDWNWYYEEYKNKLLDVTKNKKEIVNCITLLCYKEFPKRDKKILWNLTGDWIPNNINEVDIELPLMDENGEYEILGERYTMKKI